MRGGGGEVRGEVRGGGGEGRGEVKGGGGCERLTAFERCMKARTCNNSS